MKELKIIELFRQRKSCMSAISGELGDKSKVIDEFIKTSDPDILMISVKDMMNELEKIRDIDNELDHLLNGNNELFKLYKRLVDNLIKEDYEEASIIKTEIERYKLR